MSIGKLGEQLARRAELDMLKSQCDGILAQMLDAHQKIEGVEALQAKALPLGDRLTALSGSASTDADGQFQGRPAGGRVIC